eukprot:ANDGO_07874.mRNA.1 hypothetical protein
MPSGSGVIPLKGIPSAVELPDIEDCFFLCDGYSGVELSDVPSVSFVHPGSCASVSFASYAQAVAAYQNPTLPFQRLQRRNPSMQMDVPRERTASGGLVVPGLHRTPAECVQDAAFESTIFLQQFFPPNSRNDVQVCVDHVLSHGMARIRARDTEHPSKVLQVVFSAPVTARQVRFLFYSIPGFRNIDCPASAGPAPPESTSWTVVFASPGAAHFAMLRRLSFRSEPDNIEISSICFG